MSENAETRPEHLKGRLVQEVVRHFNGDARRVEHALEVLRHAEAMLEETPEANRVIVLAAAATHDFGVTEGERLHGSSAAEHQERYGPPLARTALQRIGLAPSAVDAVCAIVARHHSPPADPPIEHRLLMEADALVNVREAPGVLENPERIERFIARNFTTQAGLRRARRVLGGDDSLFVRMGAVYKLLVDEDARENKERDFLLRIAREACPKENGAGAARVLDLACGTGFHARLLARAGCDVTAVDFSPRMLKEARAREIPGAIDYRWGDLAAPPPVETPPDLALILGNTLSVFPDAETLRTVLHNAAEALRLGGRLLCQTLNYERLRAGGGALTARQGRVGGAETLLTKTLRFAEDGRVLLMLAAAQPDAEGAWQSESRCSVLTPWNVQDLTRAAEAAGLTESARWGGLDGSYFEPRSSADVVLLFQKL